MRKHLFFMGIVVTALVILFTASAGIYLAGNYSNLKKGISQSALFYGIPGSGLPLNRTGDDNAPQFRPNPPFSSQPRTFFICLHQRVLYSFTAFVKRQDIDKYRFGEPSTFHSFFMALFRVIISPNAP